MLVNSKVLIETKVFGDAQSVVRAQTLAKVLVEIDLLAKCKVLEKTKSILCTNHFAIGCQFLIFMDDDIYEY